MSTSNEMTGGEALARALQAHGVGPIFGMGGFQLLPFYDAVRRLGMTHSLISDERNGAFAADAYARVTGRVGVCDATLGPGATNLVTGLVESLNGGTPVIAIVGDTHRAHSWKNMTQEARQLDILRPAVKEVLRVERIERLPELVHRAFMLATGGRAGPVVLDVPEDVAHDTYGFEPEAFAVDPIYQAIPALRCRADAASMARAAELLAAAERPLVLAGGGVHLSDAAEALQAFAVQEGIPVAHTLSGKGAIACTHALSAGIFGRYSRIANDLIEASDLLLVIGCKLGEIATKRYTVPPSGKTVIHLDIDPGEIGRTYPTTLPLWSDARAGIEDLSRALEDGSTERRAQRQTYANEVVERMAAWRTESREKLVSDERPITMGRLMHEIQNALPDDGILIADGGFAAHWGGLLFDSPRAGRSFVPDRGFASIGYGLPGAIGARLGAPDRPVVAVTGDGGFNMTLGELETARRLGLGIVLVVVNNAASGYVKALQHLMYGEDAYQSSDLSETDYARTAEALGCLGIRVEDPAELPAAFAHAFEAGGPAVIDVIVTRDPADMLPGVDSRTMSVKKGDRVA
ncbi:MAG: thiamine pyrophosphate-binding protein [Alphaproteobacteria bacterium]